MALPDPYSPDDRCPICHQNDRVEWWGTAPFRWPGPAQGKTQAMCKRCGLGFAGVKPPEAR